MTRSCARRSFAADTIFMALVICCVFLTERIRRRRSIRFGMLARGGSLLVAHQERGFEFAEGGFERGLQIVVDLRFLAKLIEDAAVALGLQVIVETLLEGAALRDRQVVEIAVGTGVDDRNLLFDRQWLILALLQNFGEACPTMPTALSSMERRGAA